MAHDLASALLPGSGCDPVSYHDPVKMASVQPSHFHISTCILTYLYVSRLSSLALCPAAIQPAFRSRIYTHFLSPCNKSPQTPWFTMAHTYWKSTVSAEFSLGKFHKEGSRCSQGYVSPPFLAHITFFQLQDSNSVSNPSYASDLSNFYHEISSADYKAL